MLSCQAPPGAVRPPRVPVRPASSVEVDGFVVAIKAYKRVGGRRNAMGDHLGAWWGILRAAHRRFPGTDVWRAGRFRKSCRGRGRALASQTVEWPGGLSPPGSPRIVREPLDSYGSHCSAVAMAQRPVGEELGVRPAEPVEPISCTLGLIAQPLELAACPPDDVGVDPPESGTQLRLVEMAVVGDPAADARIVHLREFVQGLVSAVM